MESASRGIPQEIFDAVRYSWHLEASAPDGEKTYILFRPFNTGLVTCRLYPEQKNVPLGSVPAGLDWEIYAYE